jgi:hypothetical protein
MSRHNRRQAEAQRRRAHKERKQAEDTTIARRMVAEDLRRAEHELRELGQRLLTYDDPLPPDGGGPEGAAIGLVIGTRDDLSPESAEAAAQKWRDILRQYPNVSVYVSLAGYDDDPREIWEIASAAEYVRQWARFAGIENLEETAAGPLGTTGAAFLGACGVFGEEVRRKITMPPATAKH